MEFHPRSGGMEVLHYTASSMNSSSTAGNRASYCKIFETVLITLCKNKGERSDCSNYWGIILLSFAGKVLARILLNRLVSSIVEEHLP